MGLGNMIRSMSSRFINKSLSKTDWSNAIRYNGKLVTDDSILESSDVYELVNDISNQVAMATPVVIGPDGKELNNHRVLKTLSHPNSYLTGFEFAKLETSSLLINGEYFPIHDNDCLHLVNNVYVELDENLNNHFKIGGVDIPSYMIRHVKNAGNSHSRGLGLLSLAKNTLNGVLSAEKVLTDKYIKGGLLAFMLKLEAHISPNNALQSTLVKKILDQLEGIDDAHTVKMIPLGKGYNIEALESPVDDAAILNYLGVYKKDIGKFLGIDVTTYQKLLQNDMEKAMMYLHNKSIKPILKNKSEHYTELFFKKDSGYRVEWRLNILDFVSYSNKTNIGYNLVRTGITTPNNVAEMLGFARQDIDGADDIYISNDLTKIKDKTDNTPDLDLKGGENNDEELTNTNI